MLVDFTIQLDNYKFWSFNYDNDVWQTLYQSSLKNVEQFKPLVRPGYQTINVTDHDFITVLYNDKLDSSTPFGYMGVYNSPNWSKHLVRIMNRTYMDHSSESSVHNCFKTFRYMGKFYQHPTVLKHITSFKRDIMFISRHPKTLDSKFNMKPIRGLQKVFGYQDWLCPEKVFQTCLADKKECWQHLFYKELGKSKFEEHGLVSSDFNRYYLKFLLNSGQTTVDHRISAF